MLGTNRKIQQSIVCKVEALKRSKHDDCWYDGFGLDHQEGDKKKNSKEIPLHVEPHLSVHSTNTLKAPKDQPKNISTANKAGSEGSL